MRVAIANLQRLDAGMVKPMRDKTCARRLECASNNKTTPTSLADSDGSGYETADVIGLQADIRQV